MAREDCMGPKKNKERDNPPGYREDNEDDSGSAGEMQQQAGEFSLEETVKV